MVIGGGLAGAEAAWQLASRGIGVRLVDMKPERRTLAHSVDTLAELVCSNSLRATGLSSAVGLLKAELEATHSLLLRIAGETAVPAGRALAVDRRMFAEQVQGALLDCDSITLEQGYVERLPEQRAIIATGPLTDNGLAQALGEGGALLHYHDAIAPLVSAEGLDREQVFVASRYETPGTGDYLNCPMDQPTYFQFVEALNGAEKTPLRDFEHAPFFEGCLPVEELAARGSLTLAHGPLKPVGLIDPRTGERPFAVVQLRAEDRQQSAFNLVGFQTRLTRGEQQRVFRMIPGLEKARFERFGQVHRNTFVDAPQTLDEQLRLRGNPQITIAGQLAGVEGYVESIACGLLAALFVAAELEGRTLDPPPATTALGGLWGYLRRPQAKFQPSNVVWSMIDTPRRQRRQSKRDHRTRAAQHALNALGEWMETHRRLF